ncbi:MAG: NAD(P)H-dependent oxidoreductase subunit E [Actinomycetota bacterium]|nr:NAD(P)H-dependent oxidoreductase subunit E [Actinomycetota bacterium]
MTAVFEGPLRADADSILGRYPEAHRRSAVMPLLYLAQSVEGSVTREALREIGALLGITTAEVEAVASFYTMYRLRPTGTHVISVCTNLACKLRGAEAVFEAAHDASGVVHGAELSDDGLFTVHEEECLGVCDFAPAVQINFCNHDTVSPERMRDLVAGLRAGEVPSPARGPTFDSFKAASRALAGLQEVPSA